MGWNSNLLITSVQERDIQVAQVHTVCILLVTDIEVTYILERK